MTSSLSLQDQHIWATYLGVFLELVNVNSTWISKNQKPKKLAKKRCSKTARKLQTNLNFYTKT